ncbi:MAG: SUMF1/EgtB/PvdO family nonheme iron enzyme [Pseudomonadota bacterium]
MTIQRKGCLFALLLLLPTLSAAAEPAATAAAPSRNPFQALMNRKPRQITNTVGMTFIEIAQGNFVMGRYDLACPDENPTTPPIGGPLNWTAADHARCRADAAREYRPGFIAQIRKPFLLGVHEVTQAQFMTVMGRNPSYFKEGFDADDSSRRPVDSVNWEDAQAFVARLNELEKTNLYRLPTEAEWEWAARAGQESSGPWGVFFFGNERNGVFRQSRSSTAVTGSMPPNAWGLYDMVGNVWEWTADFFNDRTFPDPTPPRRGSTHVIKGGSFVRDAYMSFPSDHAGGPAERIDVGFRVLRATE